MMSIFKNHIPVIIVVCTLAVILIFALYIVFFFNKTAIRCDSAEKLTELIRTDFSDVEITDIRYDHYKDESINAVGTRMFIFLKESGKLESQEYYLNSNGDGVYDPQLKYVPPGNIEDLKEIGIELSQIQKHGFNYSEISVGYWTAPFEIHWYQIDETYDGKSNVVLLTSIPRKILINVDKIIES